jgi:hypothetical protein
MRTSEAAKELIAFCNSVPDPFGPNWDASTNPNPWLDGGGGKKRKFLCF